MSVKHIHGWKLDPERCPCDVDFVSYMKENNITQKNIFHMGSGLHHSVGIQGAKLGNRVTSITNDEAEYAVYAKMAKRRGEILAFYQCILGNIYKSSVMGYRPFDIINLFHLGEQIEPNDPGPAWVISTYIDKMKGSGKFIFYRGSSAIDRMSPRFEQLEANGFRFMSIYKSLLICEAK